MADVTCMTHVWVINLSLVIALVSSLLLLLTLCWFLEKFSCDLSLIDGLRCHVCRVIWVIRPGAMARLSALTACYLGQRRRVRPLRRGTIHQHGGLLGWYIGRRTEFGGCVSSTETSSYDCQILSTNMIPYSRVVLIYVTRTDVESRKLFSAACSLPSNQCHLT